MISSLRIEGYRGFEQFEMSDLGRVNLFVGTNNSGKTSVLEAIYLLHSAGDPSALYQILSRRGERTLSDSRSVSGRRELDICHLFNGHELRIGRKFTIEARNENQWSSLNLSIVELTKKQSELPGSEVGGAFPLGLQIDVSRSVSQDTQREISGNVTLAEPIDVVGGVSPKPQVGVPGKITQVLPLSRNGGVTLDVYDVPLRMRRQFSYSAESQFITPESLDSNDLTYLWDKIALGPDEPLVLRALQFLDPDIMGIAAQASSAYSPQSRGAFIVKRQGSMLPIPIGSMGDGMWRMLALAIAITQCKSGVLIVDEIDTGFHYMVMASMWKLVLDAAREFDVQVFASTHSYDCVYSLADICVNSTKSEVNPDITLHRIENGKPRAEAFDETEIRVAAERNIELR